MESCGGSSVFGEPHHHTLIETHAKTWCIREANGLLTGSVKGTASACDLPELERLAQDVYHSSPDRPLSDTSKFNSSGSTSVLFTPEAVL